MEELTESRSLTPTKTGIYWQRWWILAFFSLFTMWGCAVWNTWSPIADTAKKVMIGQSQILSLTQGSRQGYCSVLEFLRQTHFRHLAGLTAPWSSSTSGGC